MTEEELSTDAICIYRSQAHSTKGQMLFLGVSSILFWSITLIQIPFISQYFGGKSALFYIPPVYGLSSNLGRVIVLLVNPRLRMHGGSKIGLLITVGGLGTAGAMVCFPIFMGCFGENKTVYGLLVSLCLVSVIGLFNSLLATGGYGLMSLAPNGAGQFYLLGLTGTGVITWPFIMLLRAIVEALHRQSSTSFLVAVVSLTFGSIVCLFSIPLYHFVTRRDPNFVAQLEAKSEDASLHSLLKTFRKSRNLIVFLWVSRVVTFVVYPGFLSLWTPSLSESYSKELYQSFMIYLGPVSDTLGQLMYRYSGFFNSANHRFFYCLTVSRVMAVIPLFILSTKSNGSESILASDVFRMLLMMGFSSSMGINYSLGTHLAIQSVSSSEEKFTLGTIFSFMAMNGLFIGSMIGLGLKPLVS